MSGVGFIAQTAEIASGTAVKTHLQINAAANHRIKVDEWHVSFKGTVNTDPPVLITLERQTDVGSMTSLSTVKTSPGDDESLQVTAQDTAVAEPTQGDILKQVLVHPQGEYTWQAPWGKEIIVPGGTRLGITILASPAVNAVSYMVGEE